MESHGVWLYKVFDEKMKPRTPSASTLAYHVRTAFILKIMVNCRFVRQRNYMGYTTVLNVRLAKFNIP